MLRIPVEGIDEYLDFGKGQGIEPHVPLTELDIAPYGQVRMFALLAPNGSWLELYE